MAQLFTCLLHPSEVREQNNLDDECPECGRSYAFPLESPPQQIGRFKVVRHLGRGFYGVSFLVESGSLGIQEVLKVVPKNVYAHFGKDFEIESRLHKEVAEETEHVVPIRDMFDETVRFGDIELECHIAVLDYVPGQSLSEFLADPESFTARAVAQVAIDLLRLLQELERKGRYHNDLHGENVRIRKLGPSVQRANAVDDSIKAIAIDLGSLADGSKSDPTGQRLGDLHEVAGHLLAMSERLLRHPDDVDDLEYRLANALREIGLLLAPDPLRQRISFRDCEEAIRDAALYSTSSWAPPSPMGRFSDAFNAQTMHPWFVSRLLVDPNDEWVERVASPMPTVITGMRGCGKTMLLRALEFHARASNPPDGEAAEERLAGDGFVGLYVSCNRLLDGLGTPKRHLHEPYARLFVAYAREALQACRHMREISRESVISDFPRLISRVVAAHLAGAEGLEDLQTDTAVERALQKHLVSLAKGERRNSLPANPAIAFSDLAAALRQCSPLWARARVLYLLDDVSTRHLAEHNIEMLLSSLLFKDETCAFKVTTETQTFFFLKSPGLIERIRPGRDIDPFDLGGAVNRRLRERGPGGGREFVDQILERRAKQLQNPPKLKPSQMLGNATLESIAGEIAKIGGKNGKRPRQEREAIYHGVTALTATCVGDIGDVISIYEAMLRRWDGRTIPIPKKVQSACYQDYCVRQLYHLNRRGKWLRDIALTFARASNELLRQSHAKRAQRQGKGRLRQYATVNVNVVGASDETSAKLRELIDAGVFVFEGGADAPRKKQDHADPITQFILTYRKLYGLSTFVGLAERDRFELSSDDLETWFAHPEDETLLTRKLGGAPWQTIAPVAQDGDFDPALEGQPEPIRLFDLVLDARPDEQPSDVKNSTDHSAVLDEAFVLERVPQVSVPDEKVLSGQIKALVLGLGFEDRCIESARRLCEWVKIPTALSVRYDLEGHRDAILNSVRSSGAAIDEVDYADFNGTSAHLPDGPLLIDVTGLSKSLIFQFVRRALLRDGRVFVAHTMADEYYPRNEDIASLLEEHGLDDDHAILEAARDTIFSGDLQPYSYKKLLPDDGDDSRRRLLCAGASAKHERLLSLLDERAYDHLEILVPNSTSPRGKLARHAGEVARREAETASVQAFDSNDLSSLVEFVARRYRGWYGVAGFDVEMALTGSKIQAVAFSALSSTLKLAQCWYVQPHDFDPKRFSVGSARTQLFELTQPSAGP